MAKKLFCLDPGHGGMINGQYVTAPRKMWRFDNGQVVYEGVINRAIVGDIQELALKSGIYTYDITGGSQADIPLGVRVDNANRLFEDYDVVYCSIHSNAGKGIGTEIYTSYGTTESDTHASIVIDKMRMVCDDFIVRPDWSDGDVDKESKFYVLVNTHMPAWLLEVGFMDTFSDAQKLLDPTYQRKVAQAVVEYMKEVI